MTTPNVPPSHDTPPDRQRQPEAESRPRPMVLFRWGVYGSLGVLATLAGAYAIYTARAVLIRVLIALFVAISLDPAVRMLTRAGVRRGWAVLLVFVVSLGLVAAFLISVIPAMVSQFQSLVQDFPGYLASLQDRSVRLRQLSDRFNLTNQIQGLLASMPSRLGSGLLGFTGRLFGAMFSTLTVLVLTIYFMADLPRLRQGLVRLFPRPRQAQFGRIADVMIDKVGAYMIGNILVSIVAGLASFVVFTILKVPFSVPLSFVVALCDLIPMIGATLGAVIGVLVALFTTDLWPTTVLVAAFFVAYQQIENYFVAPRILRSTVNLSAAAVLLAGLIGATALGLVGALMAIPVAAGLKVVLTEKLVEREAADARAEAERAGAAKAAGAEGDGAEAAPAGDGEAEAPGAEEARAAEAEEAPARDGEEGSASRAAVTGSRPPRSTR
jgi:predicted PurR-regulated permease PerM